MLKSDPYLLIELNSYDVVFYAIESDEQNNLEIICEKKISITSDEKDTIIDFDKINSIIKKNIYLIEIDLNLTFKDTILILDTLNINYINLSGYKKLNGSQVLRENITYILNSLKSYVNEIEPKKKIIHIFNSKFNLDNKKINNLPIGLFGDFYSHELSFLLIDKNDLKNLKKIFDNCNLKIKKIINKSFVTGANLSDNFKNIDTFFHVKILEETSRVFYFENNSLKFEQKFKFGTNIILNDISKITSLKKDIIINILDEIDLNSQIPEDDLIENKFYGETSLRKIKKKLIYDIAFARIKEISEIIIFNNINLKYYNNLSKVIFLETNVEHKLSGLKGVYKNIFSKDGLIDLNFHNTISSESFIRTANKIVHFGWKKEAIPVTQTQKSIIGRFFDALFG